MFTQDAIDHFGSKAKLAKALEVSQPAVSRWGNRVPEKRAARLSLMTNGVLVYDPKDYQSPVKPADAA
ncbi:TPA: helix-turn-helix domain-containing protein [Enterobacter asburiae]|nr:helix-turn-helix domain-containing protein [Enterobacter asburiae]